MRTHIQKIFTVLKNAFIKWYAKDPLRESGIIAYYAIFSLPGLLVAILSLAGYFFGREAVNHQVAAEFTSTMGVGTANQIQDIIVQASRMRNSLLATVVGIITILVGATGVFVEFQNALNSIWEVKVDTTKSGIWQVIRIRLFSFGLIISIAFLLIVSLLVSALIAGFGAWLSGHFSDSFLLLLQGLNTVLSFLILSVLFAIMFKILPDANIKWKHVWIGSFVTALLFGLGKYALGIYFSRVNPGIGYGAAGSIILIMLWVTYSSAIVLYGAEFTHAYANMFSGRVAPNEIAKVTPQPPKGGLRVQR
jgi:membrane protein